MSIRPLGDNLVIEIIDDAEQTSGGIFIPDSAKEKPQKGKVVAIGTGKTLKKKKKAPMEVKVGEIVLYAKYAGTDVKVDNVMYKILSVKDVLGILE